MPSSPPTGSGGIRYVPASNSGETPPLVSRDGSDDDEEEYLERESDEKDEDIADFGEDDLQVAGVVIEDLNWRVEKLRLEEANKRRFLKAKPVFLPYEDACKWVQAWGQRWMSSEDWYVQSLISACGFVLV